MAVHRKREVAAGDPGEALAHAALAGRKLAVLIAALPVDDETKQAFLALVENSTYDELLALEDALEGLYADAATQDVDRQLKAALEQFKVEMDARTRRVDETFLAKLQAIERRIATQ